MVSSGRVGLLQVVSISDAERLAVRPGLFKDISDIVLTPHHVSALHVGLQ